MEHKPVILFKLTTKFRPVKAIHTLTSIIKYATGPYVILVSCDNDDKNTRLIQFCKTFNIYIAFGDSHSKISAINRDMDLHFPWDILVNVSDDQLFLTKGFDQVIRDAFKGEKSLFLHIPDGNRKDFSTISIMDREYYNLDGYIYHPSYFSFSCDVEATEVAKLRGMYKFLDVHIVTHYHPSFHRRITKDRLYVSNNKYALIDQKNYMERLKFNFGLNTTNFLCAI